jgi:lipopolysaccharide heptosyltransferase II
MMTRPEWRRAINVLCVRLDNIGDVLMTSPAIKALKESGNGRTITLLTSHAGAAIARLIPEVDDVVAYDAPWMKATRRTDGTAPDLQLIRLLRTRHFDGAAIFTVYSQSALPAALLCYLTGIPLRLAHARENPYHLLTNWIVETEPHVRIRHEVERQLDLVAEVGARPSSDRLSMHVPWDAVARVRRRLLSLGLPAGRRWLVLHPGATAASRRYPPESFAAVIRTAVLEDGYSVVLTGDPSEAPLAATIATLAGVPIYSLVGTLTIEELAALVNLAPLLVSNNTGPVHMAAALGTPVVDLYALTNPQHTPWRVASRVLFHDVPCRYCYKSACPMGHHRCLRAVPPSDVMAAIRALMPDSRDPNVGPAFASPVARAPRSEIGTRTA